MTLRSWLRKLFARTSHRAPGGSRKVPAYCRPRVEALEDRLVLTTFHVNSLLDDGSAGTLRWAITQANATPGPDAIDFQVAGTVILNGTALPPISDDLTITAPAAGLTVDAHQGSRIFQVNAGATVGLSGLALANGSASDGGGIVNFGTLALTDCTLAGNASGNDGGAIENQGGTLALTRCTLSGNSAGSDGGGILSAGTLTASGCTLSGNSAGDSGGGIENTGTMTLTNCTVSDNQAGFSGAGLRNDGAAVAVQGCTIANNTAIDSAGVSCNAGVQSFSNSTFFHNQATDTADFATAGGVASYGGTTSIVNCTFSGDQSVSPDGGDDVWASDSLTFANTIFTGSAATADPNVAGAGVTGSLGHNLSTDASFTAAAGDQLNTDPRLAPLANNGGPTQTLALLAGSPAIDAGDNTLAVDQNGQPLTTDQRGAGRIFNGAVDIGAYERQATPAVTWANPAAIASGTALDGTQFNAAADVPGTFAYTPAGGTLLDVGTQTLSVLFTPTDRLNYETATASVPLTVGPALPNITLSNSSSVIASVPPGVAPAAPALQGVFLAGVAPQGTPVVGPVVVFNDPVFFGRKALQLRDRHGHSVRLRLQVFYLPTGQTVVVLGGSTGGLNWRDLVAGKCVLTIDGRRVFDAFGRGPLGGTQKLRFFPLLSDPGALGPLAAALGLPAPA
jgi:hypothetical protein